MATRKQAAAAPKEQAALLVSREEAEAKLQGRIEASKEISSMEFNSMDDYDKLRKAFSKWDAFNTELLKRLFSTEELANEYSYAGVGTISMSMYESSVSEKVSDLRKDLDHKVHELDSIIDRLELFPAAANIATSSNMPAAKQSHISQAPSKKVFIVHGRDDGAKNELQSFLYAIGLEPIILHQMADQGMTVIEKFETHTAEVGYVFVLLTPDEIAYLAPDDVKPDAERTKEYRARPNVILEFGYFVGKLGRNKVCCLYKGNLTLPSDLHGLVYKKFINSVEEVGIGIIKDLRAAGYTDVRL